MSLRTSSRPISIFQEVELKLEVRKLNAFRGGCVDVASDGMRIEQQKPPKKRRSDHLESESFNLIFIISRSRHDILLYKNSLSTSSHPP